MKLTSIIIENKPSAADHLKELLSGYSPQIQVIGIAYNAKEGIDLIKRTKPDIAFLDINMPFHSGFDVLEHFELNEFFVVFTTAYQEDAISAIKHNAFDYLLKPITPIELEKSIKRIQSEFVKRENSDLKEPLSSSLLSIPVKEGVLVLKQEDILRIEGDGSYSTFFTCDLKKYIVSKNLKEYEELLSDKDFFRAHKSHLINIRKVKNYERTDCSFVEMVDGSVVELARRKKEEFLLVMNALK